MLVLVNRNGETIKIKAKRVVKFIKWARSDLNRRPKDYESSALTN